MSRLWRWWESYWFEPAPLFDLAVTRVVLVGMQIHWLLVTLPPKLAELESLPTSLYDPLPVLELLLWPFGGGDVRPSFPAVQLGWVLAVASAMLALIGWMTRSSLAVLALASVFLQAYSYSFGDFHHREAVMMLALIVLALGPSGGALSVDARRTAVDWTRATSAFARWPLRTMQWLMALIYGSAALSKIAIAGLAWMNGYTLRHYLLRDGRRWDRPLGVWLAEYHEPVVALSVMSLLFEATFFLAVLIPILRWIYLPVGTGFHTGIYVAMKAPFFQFIAMYAAFVPWSAVLHHLSNWRRGRA